MTTPSSNQRRFSLKNFDGAIIDLDGTLVDTLGDFEVAINMMLDDLGLSGKPQLARHEVERMVGKGSEHLVNAALNHCSPGSQQSTRCAPATDVRHPLFVQALDVYHHHYQAINGLHAAVYPGVIQGLASFQKAGLRMACVTNKPLAFAQALIRLKRLDPYFACVFGGDSFERKKPDPLPLIKACEALGVSTARTIMLGDSINDAQAGRAAGCAVVLVTYGYHHDHPMDSLGADLCVDSFTDIQG